MIKNVTIPARLAHCEVCQYEWITILEPPRLPSTCQNRECRSREWNGKKEQKVPEKKPQVVLPKPRKVRQVDDGDGF